jgi:hypothetical protein
MTDLFSSAAHDGPNEILIERTIMFRNSTFGGLKTFIRTHKRRTGETLTSAAAVDLLVRKALVREIHPDAVRLMQRVPRMPCSVLLGIGDGFEDAPEGSET